MTDHRPHTSILPSIHSGLSTNRYVLRAANTGISAIITPHGRIVKQSGIFEESVIRGSFALKDGQTPYVRFGEYFMLMAALSLLFAYGARLIASRR